MDGKRTLAEIKKDEEFKNLPVVIFTTSSARTDQAFCDYYGVTMFSKPSSLATIKQEVAQMLAYCAEV
jgi:CheY-like chemotaxis protein